EVHDLLESLVDLLTGHAVQPGCEIDVLPSSQVRGETTGDLDQRCHSLVDPDLPLIGQKDPGHDLQQRGLPLTITTADADRFAFVYIEGNIAKRPEAIAHGTPGPLEDEFAQTHILSGAGELHPDAVD